MEEEDESQKAFSTSVNNAIQIKQQECARAENRLQKFCQAVAQGTRKMEGQLEVSTQSCAEDVSFQLCLCEDGQDGVSCVAAQVQSTGGG
jgi:hypothetical protein